MKNLISLLALVIAIPPSLYYSLLMLDRAKKNKRRIIEPPNFDLSAKEILPKPSLFVMTFILVIGGGSLIWAWLWFFYQTLISVPQQTIFSGEILFTKLRACLTLTPLSAMLTGLLSATYLDLTLRVGSNDFEERLLNRITTFLPKVKALEPLELRKRRNICIIVMFIIGSTFPWFSYIESCPNIYDVVTLSKSRADLRIIGRDLRQIKDALNEDGFNEESVKKALESIDRRIEKLK